MHSFLHANIRAYIPKAKGLASSFLLRVHARPSVAATLSWRFVDLEVKTDKVENGKTRNVNKKTRNVTAAPSSCCQPLLSLGCD